MSQTQPNEIFQEDRGFLSIFSGEEENGDFYGSRNDLCSVRGSDLR